ncbi:alpha-N-acetylgalactosaminide alpha-2,6-sialyltransferase 1, partial [Anolis carolinensis]|uniref:alpha-N-acetylgalactosaminide alpha-2,6-sialyltransferase 1 n=1 Tax=Anolis carolinensis TaxID=28377 RepID=UPI002F2B2693
YVFSQLPFSPFSYFHCATGVPQVDIQKAILAPITANRETPAFSDPILGPDSSQLEQNAIKRFGDIKLHFQNTPFKGSTKPDEKQTRNKNIISVTTRNVAEVKLWSTPNKNKEKNKSTMPKHHGKKQAFSSKQTVKKDATTTYDVLQLQGGNITTPPNTNQTKKKQTRETNTSEIHSAKVEPFSAVMGHNASTTEIQQTTHLIHPTVPKNRFKASDFKSQPHWDFEDEYLLDNAVTQSSCPDSLRVKAVRSDWLKDVFLPNITLFMDRSHFSNSEWERMEHFKPPYGFMQLNYSLVKEVITLLPPKPYYQILWAHNSSNQTSRCITCAVVGNGGILNNSKMGQEIDSHDYVFRVSGAMMKGYEEDVGTKTSFYGFTAYSVMASLVSLRNRGFKKIPMGEEIKYLHFLEGERDYEWLKALLLNVEVRKGFLDQYGPRPRDVFSPNFKLDKYFVIHPDFIRYMKNRFLKSKNLDKSYWKIYRPTTGAFLLLTALHLCDKVSAYGYITEGYQKYSDHYYDKQWKRLIFYTNHDFDLERKVWKRLHDEQIMKLYQRS